MSTSAVGLAMKFREEPQVPPGGDNSVVPFGLKLGRIQAPTCEIGELKHHIEYRGTHGFQT